MVLVRDAGVVWVAIHYGVRPTHSRPLVVGPDWRSSTSATALRLRCHAAIHRDHLSPPVGEVAGGNVGGLLPDPNLLDLSVSALLTQECSIGSLGGSAKAAANRFDECAARERQCECDAGDCAL